MKIIKAEKIIQASNVTMAEQLLKEKPMQIGVYEKNLTVMKGVSHIILDFGKELCGGVRIITHHKEGSGKLRLRFGESVTETCAELGEKNATNDHALRDFYVEVANYSDMRFGQTGFRFLRVDCYDETDEIYLKTIVAVSDTQEREILGKFECSDPLVNKIWNTAAYTLQLCLQNGYCWDGIKRDRLVWVGDLYPEMRAAQCLFGYTPEINNSLVFAREETVVGEKWMPFYANYSIWWLIIIADQYLYTNNKEDIRAHLPYAKALIEYIANFVDENGGTSFEPDFIDWPTNYEEGEPIEKKHDSHTGTYYLLSIALDKCKKLFKKFKESTKTIEILQERLKKRKVYVERYKQIAALGILAGDITERNKQLVLEGGAAGMSTFMSYFILTAMASCGQYELAFESMKEYYGGMLQLGATTFWEDFDLEWTKNAARIDEFPKEGQKDIHGDFGQFCYKGFRHSLCHGWSAGVMAYLMETVAGIQVKAKDNISIQPHLSGLKWVKVSYPTTKGMMVIEHTLQEDGSIKTEFNNALI